MGLSPMLLYLLYMPLPTMHSLACCPICRPWVLTLESHPHILVWLQEVMPSLHGQLGSPVTVLTKNASVRSGQNRNFCLHGIE